MKATVKRILLTLLATALIAASTSCDNDDGEEEATSTGAFVPSQSTTMRKVIPTAIKRFRLATRRRACLQTAHRLKRLI
mgnify:CR=1 FL=1